MCPFGQLLAELIDAKEAVIGISVHGNLDVALQNSEVQRCSAAGLVLHIEMLFGIMAERLGTVGHEVFWGCPETSYPPR